MMMWFHCLHIPLYTELNFHVRKSQSVAGTFLFGCSFKKRMKNLEVKINSWKMKLILTRKLKAYSHAKQLEKLGLWKSLWMRNDRVQLNEAAVKLKQSAKEKKLTFLPPLPNNLEIKVWSSGSIHLPSPAVWARCTCRATPSHPWSTSYLEAFKEHREVAWKVTPQREEGTEEEISISWVFVSTGGSVVEKRGKVFQSPAPGRDSWPWMSSAEGHHDGGELEHLPCEERQRELELSGLEQESFLAD